MKIGLLKVDSVNEELIAVHKDYDHMFADLFSQKRPHWELVTYDIINSEFPQHLDVCDGYLVTGSQYSTYDDYSWIKDLELFIQRCHNAEKKLIGICFGHQLVAQALGGYSGACERGWGVGVKTITLNAPFFFLKEQPKNLKLIYSHQDQVQELPPTACLLGSNPHCPIASYSIGTHVWCCQGHPEFSETYAEALYLRREEKLGREVMLQAIDSLKKGTDRFQMAEWMARFFETP
jgi:GMP synthase-like glutamine amidotransferase